MKIRKVITKNSGQGITLIEIIVYIGLLGGIAVFTSNFLIQIVNTYHRARAEREVVSNGRLIMETINQTIASSQEVYAPTSLFNTTVGQLSLITAAATTTEHATGYIDYYVDNGRFWTRPEGQSAVAISATSVQISRFRVERVMQGLAREAIKVTLQVDYGNQKFATTVTLNSTTALRGNY